MLVLSRRCSESLVFTLPNGDRITVQVTEIKLTGHAVRLGIDAPKDVTIHRKEIQDVIDREKG